jgi:uncharacterized protein YjbI with pentapeptide repeats
VVNIVKPLHLGIIYKPFSWKGVNIFSAGNLIPFSLSDGTILLEQKMWGSISELLADAIFDTAMPKDRGEMLVAGSFYAPEGQSVDAGQVSVSLGDVEKQLLIYPPRYWAKLLGAGVGIVTEGQVSQVPISYSLAYGGEGYAENPVGVGHKPVMTDTGEKHFLPQIEYKNRPVTSPGGRYRPAGLGRVDQMWEPRLSMAGTYDEAYLSNRFPGLADDVDWRFFNEAAADQQINGFWSGFETYRIENMHPGQPVITGTLPAIQGRIFINRQTDSGIEFMEIPARLETVWFFPDADMGVMIYRGTTEIATNDASDVRALLLACEGRSDQPRSLEHYQDQLSRRLDPENGWKYALNTAPLIAEGMVCGFQQLQEENDFPLSMEAKKNLDAYSEERKADAEQQKQIALDAMAASLKAAGVDPTPHLNKALAPEKPPMQQKLEAAMEKAIPGILVTPEKIDLSRIDLGALDDVRKIGDQVKKDKIAEAKIEIRKQIEELKASPGAEAYADVIARMEQQLADMDLPPMWPRIDFADQIQPLRQQVLAARQQLDDLRRMGVPEDQLPNLDVDLDGLEARLSEAETRLKDTYRTGAHMLGVCRSPHPQDEVRLRSEFLALAQSGGSLRGRDFACIDLGNQHLKGLDLSDCYLEGVNFSGAVLEEVVLENAILAGANLSSARLMDCNARGANLGATNMANAELVRVDLTEGQLSRSQLDHCLFEHCLLPDMVFLETTFRQPRFLNCDMTRCNFIEADLSFASFSGSDLTESNLLKPRLQDADFSGAVLGGCNFVEAGIERGRFVGATIINGRFVGSCVMPDCDFSNADIRKSCLRDNRLCRSIFAGANVTESDFSGSDLTGSSFYGAQGYRTQFMSATLTDANLVRFNLMEGSLYKAWLVGADFSGANLYSVNFMDTTLGNNRYQGANLDQTILKDWRPS